MWYMQKRLNWELSYIAQTSRNLADRLVEHRSDIKTNKHSCALADHVLDTNHEPDYTNVSILDFELVQRKLLEMTHVISCNNHCMNKKSDFDNLKIIFPNPLEMYTKLHSNQAATTIDNFSNLVECNRGCVNIFRGGVISSLSI